jgi:hypothetical protein
MLGCNGQLQVLAHAMYLCSPPATPSVCQRLYQLRAQMRLCCTSQATPGCCCPAALFPVPLVQLVTHLYRVVSPGGFTFLYRFEPCRVSALSRISTEKPAFSHRFDCAVTGSCPPAAGKCRCVRRKVAVAVQQMAGSATPEHQHQHQQVSQQ